MALIRESDARAAARRTVARLNKSMGRILEEASTSKATSFDIFLSHSRLDEEVIVGVKALLEETGYSVYVDWIDDPHLDRRNVTAETAEKLRARMKQCRALFYAHSSNATKSRWMPWELGFFDGRNGNVSVLPVVKEVQISYKGEEYLGLYPYVDITQLIGSGSPSLFIHRSAATYARFENWITQADKLRPG